MCGLWRRRCMGELTRASLSLVQVTGGGIWVLHLDVDGSFCWI